MGSDESHFNVSVGSDGQSHRTVHKPQPFWRERRAEAVSNRSHSAYQPNTFPLGQTGSRTLLVRGVSFEGTSLNPTDCRRLGEIVPPALRKALICVAEDDDDEVMLNVLKCQLTLGTSCDQCRSMVQYSFTSSETRRLVRTDSPGRPPRLSHSSWTMTSVWLKMMMSWCLMSSDVIWHIRDKLWPMPKHGSIKSTYVRCMRV